MCHAIDTCTHTDTQTHTDTHTQTHTHTHTRDDRRSMWDILFVFMFFFIQYVCSGDVSGMDLLLLATLAEAERGDVPGAARRGRGMDGEEGGW